MKECKSDDDTLSIGIHGHKQCCTHCANSNDNISRTGTMYTTALATADKPFQQPIILENTNNKSFW